MSSNASTPSLKGGAVPVQLPSPFQPQGALPQGDGNWRRTGVSGQPGTGSGSRAMSSPRNNQALRKQHKGRRPKLGFEDAAIENAAIRSAGSRKGQTSITHLMNFTLPPLPQSNHSFAVGRHGTSRRPTWGLGSGYHASDKARYIHANYRFIVDPRGEYRQHTVDADIHLDWNLVLQILSSAQSQDTSCPICLSTPVAPRMAKCGHIFCLPCLIRYIHSTDDVSTVPEKRSRWKKCPICWDSIYMSETRPVKWYQGQEGSPPTEGGDVVLRLMMREAGSILALPRDGAESSSTVDDIPWFFAAEVQDYARIMKGSEEYMQASFDQEIKDISLQEQEDQIMFGEETVWSRKAISAIKDLKEKSLGIGSPPTTPKKPEERILKRPPVQFNEVVPEFYAIQNAAKSGRSNGISPAISTERSTDSTIANGIQVPQNPLSSSSALIFNRSHDSPFFFYQALLHYYLSPLDIRILKAAFGGYSSFPSTILPRVERVSTGHIVDDDLRKRAKYLGHLPHGCEVNFLECDWTDVVVPKVLEGFAHEIERRRERNMAKEAREEKERQKAERGEDDKRWAAARRKRPSVSKAREDLPVDLRPSNHISLVEPHPLGTSAASSSPPWGSHSRRTGSTFASLASPSTSPSAPRTVWGTALVTPSSPHLQTSQPEDMSENDGWLQDWERDLLQDEALVTQVKSTSIRDAGVGGFFSPISSNAGNKKKKNKKITIMSTNARRAA